MEKLRVVVADDIDIMRTLMADKLKEDERIEVVGIAEDGLKEFEMIKELKPDLVITDNQMPNMSGMEVIEKVAEEELEKKPAFIMVSGDTFGSRYRELNVLWIFNKPVDYDNILRFIIEEFFTEHKNSINEDETEWIIGGNQEKKTSILDKLRSWFN
ncbi:response regulator [bacterium]|nr:response regulator [bacterium]